MRSIILILIHAYWFLIPESRRKGCVFHETCSKYVFRITNEHGTVAGLRAFANRFLQCRPGYLIYQNGNRFEMRLKNGDIIQEQEIAQSLLLPIRNMIAHREEELRKNETC